VKPFQRERFALALERGRQWRKQALEELQWHAVLSVELRDRTQDLCAEVARIGRAAAIERLSGVLGTRAPDVLEHSTRVTLLAVAVARELGLDTETTTTLDIASRLHDVGKAAMPEALLSKPSPLSPGEAAIMRRHVEAGADILACAPPLAPCAPIVLASHEWFGGGGYPRNVAGAAIPLESRIISVADAFDTMTRHPRDRAAVEQGGAVEELLRCAHSQFDEDVLTAFLAVLGRQ
jgi:putative nucleotidyltransferase with HDIG domain